MGYEAGFDFFPSLNNSELTKWNEFINDVCNNYRLDKNIVETKNKILFKVGNHPKLPKNGLVFRSFWSKISGGSYNQSSYDYIKQIATIATKFFPNRIFEWYNGDGVSSGIYDWVELSNPSDKYVNNSTYDISKFSKTELENEIDRLRLKLLFFEKSLKTIYASDTLAI